jgi:molybdopterin/thiamine biosynthesis adenylyltransferase
MDIRADTAKLVRRYSKRAVTGSGQKIRLISLADSRSVASQLGLTPLQAEIACLENGVVPMRYLRNMGTVGMEGQLQLLRSTVAVCGAGGLGGTVIELLARQGLGRLVIIDNGRFVENNLNRQILSDEDVLRKSKVKVAAGRVRRINSAVVVKALNTYIDDCSVDELLSGADAVVDALDSLETRLVVEAACRRFKIPFVHGAIAGRKARGIEAVTGNPPATPAIIAAWEVQEVVKLITGIGTPLRNRLLLLDFTDGSLEEISLV